MVKITVIGWYGTETIGDRAILAGLFSLFSGSYGDYEIQLGAIYPFYTERTLLEDELFLRACAGKERVPVVVFDSMSPRALRQAIRGADMVVIGGGPLYDSPAMYMLEYAFKYARSRKKQTFILGCGVGPLYKKTYRKVLQQIIQHTDLAIFRDKASATECASLKGKPDGIFAAIDPAVFALSVFKTNVPEEPQEDCIAVAIRKYPGGFRLAPGVTGEQVDESVACYLEQIQQLTGKELRLVPMNYCDSGGDDRKIMNRFRFCFPGVRVRVQNEPLNMFGTMRAFRNSWGCIGMRFHAVVFQTLLNGNNLILDYTDVATGKIGNFLQQSGGWEHYRESYVNLLDGRNKVLTFCPERFQLREGLLTEYRKIYEENL